MYHFDQIFRKRRAAKQNKKISTWACCYCWTTRNNVEGAGKCGVKGLFGVQHGGVWYSSVGFTHFLLYKLLLLYMYFNCLVGFLGEKEKKKQ